MPRRLFGSFITSNPTLPTSTTANGIWPLFESFMYIGKNIWPGFSTPNVNYLVVGGGAGGGGTNGNYQWAGGGGGAGQVLSGTL